MIKKFKNKKKSHYIIKVLLFFIVVIISFIYVFKTLYFNLKSEIKEEDIIKYLVYGKSNINYENLFRLNSTQFLLEYSLGISLDRNGEEYEEVNYGDYMEDPAPSNVNEPLIYLYNTHQSESYNKDLVTSYNISPTVLLTSYMLREKLNDLGLPTIVETTNIKDVLNEHQWVYKNSYQASRILLEKSIKEYPSLQYFIDIHRDSSLYNKTTFSKDNNSYAKILFVVGLDHPNYEYNLSNATKLNNIINDNYPGLSRGIMKKSGNNVNGIYNQDFHYNTFLIEIGGQYNNIEEVKNTINPLANAIHSYIKENDYEEKN